MKKRISNIDELKSLGHLLDTKFRGPFGTKFGIDGLLGLIPGVGDLITSALSIYIIAQAAAIGVAPSVLMRMALNLALENIFDLVPILGNFFDFYWKANIKNLQLIEGHIENPARETIRSRMIVGLVAVILIALVVISTWFSFKVLIALFHFINTSLSN